MGSNPVTPIPGPGRGGSGPPQPQPTPPPPVPADDHEVKEHMPTFTAPNLGSWKTTAAGILSGYLAVVGPLTAYLATTPNPTSTKICGALTIGGIIARAWVGLISQDAGSTPAIVPGVPGVTSVPSHETPDSPAAIPVSEVATPAVAPFPKPTIKP